MQSPLASLITLLTFYLLAGCAPKTDNDTAITTTQHPRNSAGVVAATMISPITH